MIGSTKPFYKANRALHIAQDRPTKDSIVSKHFCMNKTLQRYSLGANNDPRLLRMSCFLVNYPFAD
jgi:hypothetical protein